MFGKSNRAQGNAMTTKPLVEGPAKARTKQRASSCSRLVKKEPNFARKDIVGRERARQGKQTPEVFTSAAEAAAAAPAYERPKPPPLSTDMTDSTGGRAPYAWFHEDRPDDWGKERRPVLEPVQEPANRLSGMKVTSQHPNTQDLVKQINSRESHNARGRKQMQSDIFGSKGKLSFTLEALSPDENAPDPRVGSLASRPF